MHDNAAKPLVFVVDDEHTIASTAAMILSSGGFDARPFTDPQAALEAARIQAPNLLLSDILMPGLNGFELSTGIVDDCPQCKILLFSGNPGARESFAKTDAEKSWKILMKPIMPANLISEIRTMLEV